jgi:hypothetical protein
MNDDYDPLDGRVEYIGPFEKVFFKLSVGGYKVPFIEGRKNKDGSWTLVLDERFAIDTTENEIANWIGFIANAMAIAAGYSSFGGGGVPHNRFKTKIIGLSVDEYNELTKE